MSPERKEQASGRNGPKRQDAVCDAVEGGIAGQQTVRAATLAERLGSEPVVFSGDHRGFRSRPAEIAETLQHVLGRRSAGRARGLTGDDCQTIRSLSCRR
jgi:hypothetical protein